MNVTNVAVVGLGWWGRTLVNLLKGNARMRVVRLVDPSPAAAEFAAALGLPLDTELAAALRDPAVQAVILCTPHTLHCEQIIATAAAGKHVFGEKPLCLTREEARRAVDAVASAGLVLGVGHEKRFEPPILAAVALARSGGLGRILQIEANFSQDKLLGLAADNWRVSATEAPAGPLTATGIHLVDLACSLLGPASSVSAHVAQLDSNLANGDTLGILMKFEGGGHALISAILATPFAGRFAIYGSQGWIEVRDKSHPENSEGWTLTTSLRGKPLETVDMPAASSVLANLEAFADGVAGRARYPVTQAELVNTVAALEAIVKSTRTGKTESLEPGEARAAVAA
jgi:predicted dehydrogenase